MHPIAIGVNFTLTIVITAKTKAELIDDEIKVCGSLSSTLKDIMKTFYEDRDVASDVPTKPTLVNIGNKDVPSDLFPDLIIKPEPIITPQRVTQHIGMTKSI